MIDPFQLQPVTIRPFRDKGMPELLEEWATGKDWVAMCQESGLNYSVLYHLLRMEADFERATRRRRIIELKERAARKRRKHERELAKAVDELDRIWDAGGPRQYAVKNQLDEERVRGRMSALRKKFPELRAVHY